MSPASPPPFRVLVIGAGSTGLSIAQGLQKHTIACTVFERDLPPSNSTRSHDWGMLLHWGTPYLMKTLPADLQARVHEARVDPDYDYKDPPLRMNAQTGEVAGCSAGQDLVRVSRRKLRGLLAEGLDVRWGMRLAGLRMGESPGEVTAVFEDGSAETGQLVIGADGGKSKVREILVGIEAARAQDTTFTMMNYSEAVYTDEEARLLRSFHPILQMGWHPVERCTAFLAVLDASAKTSPSTWRFQNYTSWAGPPSDSDLSTPASRVKFWKRRAAAFCEPFRTAVLAIPDDALIPINPLRQWAPPMHGWDNRGGRVTLAGDAAHSVLPHRGQGLNNALMDASEIVDAVLGVVSGETGLDLKQAVGSYEAEMIPRGRREVELSYEAAKGERKAADGLSGGLFHYGRGPLVQGGSRVGEEEARSGS